MKLPRPAIYLGGVVALLLVAGLFAVWLLPVLLDSRLIRDRISAEFTRKIGASVTVGKIDFVWLPLPAVVIENAQVSFDARTRGSIQTTKIYPSLFYLLAGRLVVHRTLLQQAKFTIRLPQPSTQPFDLSELEKQIRSALAVLTNELPVSRIDLSDGWIEISIGDRPPVVLENLAAQTAASSAELRFEFSARSNLSERFKGEGKIALENLAGRLNVGVQRLKIKESLDFLPSRISQGWQSGEASFDVNIAATGLRQVTATFSGSTGPLVLARQGATATLAVNNFRGGIGYESGAFQVDVEQLDLGAPRLKAAGQFKIHSGSLSAIIKARDVDIAEIGELAVRIVDDAEAVRSILRYVPAGRIAEITIQSAGRSLADMALSKNILISGLLSGGTVFIPGPELDLQNVNGAVRISRGILAANNISANLGTIRSWSGDLRLGLEGPRAPFHLDISLRGSAAELHSVLLEHVHDETFRGELLKVRNVSGELSGRLILGERLDAIAPVVTISEVEISATYAPIAFPIAIRGGRFSYDQRVIRLENAQGSVGLSTFGELGVTLHHGGGRQIKVDSGRISLDLQQTGTLVRSLKNLPSHFEKLQSARGRIELDNLTLTGAYDDPAQWTFASAGRFDRVEITHADFPDRVTLARGKFAANQEQIIFSDAAAALSDASLIAGGTFEYKKGGAFQFETSGTGTIGGQMTQWLSRYLELPEEFELRSPLKIAAAQLGWRSGGDISFRGQVTVADGPLLTLDVTKQSQGLALRNLTVDDGSRHARMTLQLAKDNLDLYFSGELTHETVDKVFASFPMIASSLRGDIQINATLAKPITVSARGHLSGGNLSIPLATEKALFEKFSIEASGSSVIVRSADLLWGKGRLALSGTVTGTEDLLRVDMDVTGDQLDWGELERLLGADRKQRQPENGGVMSIAAVEGVIRLKTDRFGFERFNLSSLEATAVISPSGIRTEINRGVVCGIHTTGRIDVVDKDIRLDLQLAATNAQLEPATICLTDQQTDVKGTYSLTARITGRGERERLRSALKGDFQLTAHNGEFVRAPGIDATFDYLNSTGDFKVAFPDLDRETFTYRFVGVKGRFEGNLLIADEVSVESSLLNLSGQGKVDMERRQIDGKGLIAVLKPVDEVLARIPVIGSMLGVGALIGIPVRVSGSLERPEVSYLPPADVGMELLNIPLRILGMPLGAMRLFTPSGDLRDQTGAE